MVKKAMTCCPHCGSKVGLFNEYKLAGIVGLYSYSGEFEEENLDNASVEGGKKLYCRNCGEYVCKVKDIEKEE